MKKLIMAMTVSVLFLGACGGVDEPAPVDPAPDQGEAPVEEEVGEETAGAYDADAAEQTYQNSCAMCHGGNLEGQGQNPALVGTGLSKEEVLTILREGKGTMPGGLVRDGEDVEENLAAWIADQ